MSGYHVSCAWLAYVYNREYRVYACTDFPERRLLLSAVLRLELIGCEITNLAGPICTYESIGRGRWPPPPP